MELQPEIYLLGASGHGKVIIEIMERMGQVPAGIFDDDPSRRELLGYAVSGRFDPAKISRAATLIIAIGNNHIRKKIAGRMTLPFTTVVHPSACVSSRATIGPGTAVMAGSTVNSEVMIGAHCIINTNASVDHDCVIDDYVHISPNVALAGNVTVAEGAHIGIGACVIQGVTIGRWATIGAGAAVIRDVPDYAVVVGNPARIIKYNSEI
ncbi:acetyltransferase [Chitinophaga arvensicola]|uniref:UDP-perosamine 4-acetyltransferase n=1 Tax=Chitinophaga arvensicola TaxID=29529 RepID=A0A1I0S8K1_9BACT|nr:acetyltransferase [Chitinophaga arvensicola]SEW52470.1 UDP-perosamine 4-acetyltransferase [Chitinophaga arvensicola]